MKLLSATTHPTQNVKTARHGFTLLELMVAICVLGIISAWAAISWNNFVRHQEVRQEAGNLHKEILAMKARALESKRDADLTYNNSKFAVNYWIDDETAPEADNYQRRVKKEFSMNNKVIIVSGDGACAGDGLPAITENNWADSITVSADNINAYDEGSVGVKSTSSNTEFCIIVGTDSDNRKSIKPELYQSSGNGKWIRM